MSARAANKNDCAALESERIITFLGQLFLTLHGAIENSFWFSNLNSFNFTSMLKHSGHSRMLYPSRNYFKKVRSWTEWTENQT